MSVKFRDREKVNPVKFRHQDDVIENDVADERRKLEGVYQYRHLSDEDRELVDCLLLGTLSKDEIPRPKSKVVKIFISSTFTDMTQERNALAETVYPKLRQYCRHKHGLDFQAVDMRWGVPPEASDDHTAANHCLAELRHCQELSIGPNFVAFVGQRYGSCPLPAAIIRAEFEAIRANLETSSKDVTLLDTCYLKDQNSLPAVYRLQPASKIKEKTGRLWCSIAGDIREVLFRGAQRAVEASELSKESFRLLKSSVTEMEIYDGLINIAREKDRQSNCLLYLRDIEGLDTDSDPKIVRRFLDLHPDTLQPNETAANALTELRGRCTKKVTNQNMLKMSVKWEKDGICPVTHNDYIQTLCNHFYATVKLMVDRNMAKRNKLQDDDLYNEVVQHWTIARNRCQTFVGRAPMIQSIRGYLEAQTDQALVVHGESGSGKTSLMSKAVSVVSEVVSQNENEMKMVTVVRFVGTTPESSSSHQLLYSVCHQLAYISKQHRSDVPEDYTSLKMYFRDVVQKGNFSGVVILFLDALDQLSPANGAHTLDWLPSRLAPNVKLIVSTLPEKHGILDKLRNKIAHNFLEVSPLPQTDCKQVMRALLEHSGRAISYPQWRIVEKAFTFCTLPLFITLTFQEAIRWNSYDDLPPDALLHTVEASINRLFDRLEKTYGKMFVSRALGYITAARNGLSMSELDDILSLDEDVLNSVFTLWEPPIRRIPSNLWPRLYLDISSFLVEQEADDIVVLSWYHTQFVRAAMSRYLSNVEERMLIHRNIAEYYLGTWSGTMKKPFVYQQRLMARLKKTDPHSAACRHVPEQPLIFKTSETCERYNLRKMNQLPYSLVQSEQIDRLKKECFCNFDWLYAKLKAVSLQQILGDFSMFHDRETSFVADALRMSGSALKIDPNALGTEISGRLLPHIHHYPIIRDLVRQCDLRSQHQCPLVPHFQIYSVPGGPLQYEWEIDGTIRSAVDVDVFNSPDGILMTAKPYYSKTLKVWELTQGEPRQDMQMPIGEIHPSKDGKYLNIFSRNRIVTIYKSDCGEVHASVDFGYGEVAHVNISNQYIAFTTRHNASPCVIDIAKGKVLHRFPCRSNAVAISPNERYIVFNADRNIMLYSLPLMERKCVGQANDEPMQIAFSDAHMKCYVLTKTRLFQTIHFDVVNRVSTTSGIVEDMEIKEFKISHLEHRILVRSSRCLYLVDTATETIIHRLQRMPPGVFVKTMTSFTGAGFTPKDDLVVASRDTYIAVWETETGTPIRLLQASVSPIVKIFTSDTLNKAVALLRDNTLQVWDLDNLDADVQHSNEVMSTTVRSVAVSSTTRRVLCHGTRYPEAKILDIETGNIKAVLQHTCDLEDKILDCELSPLGLFAVTKAHLAEKGEYSKGFKTILTDDIVWNMSTQEKIHHAPSNRYIVFNTINSIIAVVQCVFYSSIDWTCNTYHVKVIQPDVIEEEQPEFSIPLMSEFVCKPVLLSIREGEGVFHTFYTVLQFCKKELHPVTKGELSRSCYMRLYTRTLLSKQPDEKILCVKDFLKHADPNDQFVDVRIIDGNKLLMIYSKDPVTAFFDKETGLVLSDASHKAAVVYDPETQTIIRHLLHIVKPDSLLSQTVISRLSSVIVDDQLRVFDHHENKLRTEIKTKFADGCHRLALDGAYIVGISHDLRSVIVVRSVDGEQKGRLFIHGKATCIEVAEDDRTVVVGCYDGRVMILSLVLGLSDPVTELIDKLPSRIPLKGQQEPLVNGDIRHMQRSLPELTRLAMKLKEDAEKHERRQTSFRALATSVTVLNKVRMRSQACSLQ
ncbi:NACHT and WD repeat domain-containing protein 2-like [Haliotis rufescens]|uniref:NACHT and WD repeat domain-containing protein 2-like n=1 Tax=Haliotis rufescens TaxID=6454 RepID=UPI00201EDB9E|nr:NACHT and WD repeat domain-containing protein 2-like [Haliotis rufescens]